MRLQLVPEQVRLLVEEPHERPRVTSILLDRFFDIDVATLAEGFFRLQ